MSSVQRTTIPMTIIKKINSNKSNALQISIVYNLKTAPHQPQRITMLVRESWIRAISCCVFHGYARTKLTIIIDYSKILFGKLFKLDGIKS